MSFLEALKQLVGLAPRDVCEVWYEKPLVIVDSDDAIVFSGTATIEYTPGADRYEEGRANVYAESNGAFVMAANIVRQRTYSSIDQSNPWRLRWSRLGVTAKAIGDDGSRFTFFIGRHAHTYLLRKQGSPLDYTPDTDTTGFPDSDSQSEPED